MKKVQKIDFSRSDDDPITVYNLAKQEWYGIVGSAMSQKKEWKRLAFFLIGVLTLSVVGNIYLSNKSNVIPYVIEINTDTGATSVTKLTHTKAYTPNEATEKAQIVEFINNIQTVSTDQIVIQNNLLKAYDMITKKAHDLLTAYIKVQRKPFDISGHKAITISSIVINKITADSYQVDWIEDHYTIGSPKDPDKINYFGTFTIKIEPPETEDDLLKNPLGIKVDEFHISQKYQAK